MAGVAIRIVGLDVADATVIILELPLEQEVRSHRRVGIVVGRRGLIAERGLEMQVIELADRDIAGV